MNKTDHINEIIIELCALGKSSDVFHFTGDVESLMKWRGHGLYLTHQNSIVECGCLCLDVNPPHVIGKSGGSSIEVGNVIVHNKQICAEGTRRFND